MFGIGPPEEAKKAYRNLRCLAAIIKNIVLDSTLFVLYIFEYSSIALNSVIVIGSDLDNSTLTLPEILVRASEATQKLNYKGLLDINNKLVNTINNQSFLLRFRGLGVIVQHMI